MFSSTKASPSSRRCRNNEGSKPALVLYTDHEAEEYVVYSTRKGVMFSSTKASPKSRRCRNNEGSKPTLVLYTDYEAEENKNYSGAGAMGTTQEERWRFIQR